MSNTTRVPQATLDWLHASLRDHYVEVDRTYNDVAHTLATYESLSPRTEVYTSEYGISSLLLVLRGTVAVSFRNNVYHFPIAIWIPPVYPQEPPFAYVTPNERLATRPGQYIGVDGRVFHPYLAQWASHAKTSNLGGLLHNMQQAFATDPPLVARRQHSGKPGQEPELTSPRDAQATDVRKTSPRDPKAPAPPPKPAEMQPSSLHLPHSQYQAEGGSSGGATQHLSAEERNGLRHGIAIETDFRAANPSPVVGPGSRRLDRSGALPITSSHHYNPRGGLGHGLIGPGRSAPTLAILESHAIQLPYRSVQQQLFPPAGPPSQSLQQRTAMHQDRKSNTARQREPSPDLLSLPTEYLGPVPPSKQAVVAPPIPRNPEKDFLLQEVARVLRAQLQQYVSKNATTIPALEAQQAALSDARHRIQRETGELHGLNDQLRTDDQILHDAVREANLLMEKVGKRDAPSIDDMLVAPTTVGEQLYKLVADERSTEDAMFGMTRALDKGRLRDDVFVKHIRSLAREQFLHKALIKKISEGMGLLVMAT